jgi:hypothetical protein
MSIRTWMFLDLLAITLMGVGGVSAAYAGGAERRWEQKRAEALRSVALALAQAGYSQKTQEAAHGIGDPDRRADLAQVGHSAVYAFPRESKN